MSGHDDDEIDDTDVHRPWDIPADVWEDARMAWCCDRQPDEHVGQQRLVIASRAIMAERKRMSSLAIAPHELEQAMIAFASIGHGLDEESYRRDRAEAMKTDKGRAAVERSDRAMRAAIEAFLRARADRPAPTIETDKEMAS